MLHDHDNTQSVLRAALYIGVFLLVGAGVFARYVGPEAATAQRWRVWYLLSGGFLLALVATLYGVYHLTWMLGDSSLIAGYLLETSQGNWLLLRIGLLAGLLFLSIGWFRLDRWLYPPLALGLLLTLTLTSHSVGGGLGQMAAGLAHLAFAAVWGGSVLALAVVWPGTRYEALLRAIQRLSGLGLAAVIALSLMGLYLSWVRLGELAHLWNTAYGQRLLLKLGLVALVVGVAAVNRLWLLPRLRSKRVKGLRTVSLEAALILGVLLSSGLLATTEPPPVKQVTPSLINIDEALDDKRYVGQLFSQGGLIHLYLDLRDPQGQLLPSGPTLRLQAQQDTERLEATGGPFYKSQYHFVVIAPTPGEWTVNIELPEKTLKYRLGVGP